MQSKKRVHLQQFDIIHLSNPDLIYIMNLERNKIMFVSFHLLKTYIMNPFLFFISFFTLPLTGKRRCQPRSARAYMRAGRWVSPSFYFCQVGLSNYWRPFFLVLPKLDGCQIDLSNCWSCSYPSGAEPFKDAHIVLVCVRVVSVCNVLCISGKKLKRHQVTLLCFRCQTCKVTFLVSMG
jgi:hypothetical protein